MIRKHKAIVPAIISAVVVAVMSGCSHQSNNPDALAKQKTDVMGSPAPPAVRAQIEAQQAQQQAAQQAAQQQRSQQAAQQDAARKQ